MSRIDIPLAIRLVPYYAKSVAAFVAALGTLLTKFFVDGTVADVLAIVIAVAGFIAVYTVPNRQPAGLRLKDPESVLTQEEPLKEGDLVVAHVEGDGPDAQVTGLLDPVENGFSIGEDGIENVQGRHEAEPRKD